MKVLQKIQKVREAIKSSDLKKSGYNDYSKYHYYTPEQVDKLVFEACKDQRLFNKYDLLRTENGLTAQIEVFDLDSDESQVFKMATDIPIIKATNISQQLGGAVTYSNRYLLMTIYDIVDNNLDFDTPKKDDKAWLNPGTPQWTEAVKYLAGDGTIEKIKTKYKLSKSNQEKLYNGTSDISN